MQHLVDVAGASSICLKLLAKGADPDARDDNGTMPILCAANFGLLEVLEALIAKKVTLCARRGEGLPRVVQLLVR